MLEGNHLLQQAAVASSTYAAFAAANMYQSFYPTMNVNTESNGKKREDFDHGWRRSLRFRNETWTIASKCFGDFGRHESVETFSCDRHGNDHHQVRVIKFLRLFDHRLFRNGRRLFPNFHITVSELDPDTKYTFLLDIIPTDDNRYKYQESAWMISGKAEPHMYGR